MSTTTGGQFDLIVIGGGAAGFFGAIAFAEARPESQTLILERGAEVLEKVRVSGGGRCNVTHDCPIPAELVKNYPRGGKELLGPFHRFSPADTVEWFENRGVPLKTEADGRMFPVSDRSQSIVDCLVRSAREAGVQVRTSARVQGFFPEKDPDGWRVELSDGKHLRARALLVATGSSAAVWEILRGLGHGIEPPVPSLFTFNVKDPRLEGLAGLSVPHAEATVPGTDLRATGPVLITHWGLSGPAVLRLSAWGARILHARQYRFDARINWTGSETAAGALGEMLRYKALHGKRTVSSNPLFGLPSRLWERLVRTAGIAADIRWADVPKGLMTALSEELCGGLFSVSGKSTFKEEFVTAGGVSLREVDLKTFRSRLHPGLCLAGETLDVDAITGGFNFQAAWTGGWIAGTSLAQYF